MYREIPRFGTRSTNRWYLSYHSVVLVVPKLGTCPTNAWYDKYQRVGRTQRLGVWPVIPCCFIFPLPDFYVFFPVRFFFSYSAAIRKCTELSLIHIYSKGKCLAFTVFVCSPQPYKSWKCVVQTPMLSTLNTVNLWVSLLKTLAIPKSGKTRRAA